MIREWIAEEWAPAVSHHAEGPVWDDRTGRLWWSDQYAGVIRSAATGIDAGIALSFDAPVGAIVLDRSDGWVAAAGRGFTHIGATGAMTTLAEVLPDDGIQRRMNDGKCDPAGRFWAGSMAYDKTPGSSTLYVLERGAARPVRDGFTISNGTAWTPDGATMFHIDTPTRRVDRYQIDSSGHMHDDGVAFPILGGVGYPDGMCIDAEGALWVALWGGGAVHRYSPAGDLLGVVLVDAPQVSSCAFGGPDYGTLFVTTSREGYGADAQAAHPRAGAIFAVRPGVSGLRADTYLA